MSDVPDSFKAIRRYAEKMGSNERIPTADILALVDEIERIVDIKDQLERELAEARKAVEFGAYLAAAAERYLAAVNYASMMCGEDGQVHDADDVVDAEQAMAESARSLRSAIYEFRKRARMRNDERHADNRCVS